MINVNLLRPERKEVAVGEKPVSYVEEERERGISMSAIVSALAATVVVMGLLFFLQNAKYQRENDIFKERELRRGELEGILQKLAQVEDTKKALDRKINIISELTARRKDTIKMMDKISSSLPDWVWLTSLNFSNNTVTIAGRAMSNNLISDFISFLNSSNHFTNVQLVSSKRDRTTGLSEFFVFQLICQYVRPQEESNKGV